MVREGLGAGLAWGALPARWAARPSCRGGALPPRPPASPRAAAWAPGCRSLGHLVNKNRDEQLAEVVAALCNKLVTGNKEQLRDVASLGLKTVVSGGF